MTDRNGLGKQQSKPPGSTGQVSLTIFDQPIKNRRTSRRYSFLAKLRSISGVA
jgi:hypothetical protein